jgi:hypothetical protein
MLDDGVGVRNIEMVRAQLCRTEETDMNIQPQLLDAIAR